METENFEEEVQLTANSIKRITAKWLEEKRIREDQALEIRNVLEAEGEEAAQQRLEEAFQENKLS